MTFTAPTKKPSQHHYYVNLLYCSECGEKYLPHNSTYNTSAGKKTTYNYQCRTRFLRGKCGAKAITAGKVEKALIAYFSQIDDEFVYIIELQRREQEKRDNEAQIKRCAVILILKVIAA